MTQDQGCALITGSSRGIGAATALALAQAGWNVAVNYLAHPDRANQAVTEIQQLGRASAAFQADVADLAQVERMVAAVRQTLGPILVLVNNAGFSSHARIDQLSPAEWARALEVNLSGAFYCVRSILPDMKAAHWGRIINLSSLRARTGSDHGAHYAAAKAGLIGFTKSLALELASAHITVNALAPGYTRTEMTQEALAQHEAEICGRIPLGRVAEPSEIAGVIAFLASEEADYITGQVIDVNGGIYMG